MARWYDRVVHTKADLAILHIGVPHAKIHLMFSLIQKMIHRMCTTYGDSNITYGGEDIGDWDNAPQGMLQGNVVGPSV